MWRLKILIIATLLSFSFASECGKVKIADSNLSREDIRRGQWPWLASIFKNDEYVCGATIISEKYLLGGKVQL